MVEKCISIAQMEKIETGNELCFWLEDAEM